MAKITGSSGFIELGGDDIKSMQVGGCRLSASTGRGDGSGRLGHALTDAVRSLGNGWKDGCRSMIICIFAGSNVANPLKLDELEPLRDFVDSLPRALSEKIKWGLSFDDNLGNSVEVSIIVGQ